MRRILVFILLSTLGILFLLFFLRVILEPTDKIRFLSLSNITDSRVTVSWTTPAVTRTLLVLSEDSGFPLFPSSQSKYHDDSDKKLKKYGFYLSHMVTIGNLQPNKKYRFRVYQGVFRKYEGSFTTGSILSSISQPNPIYGRVLSQSKVPVVGALVYFAATKGATQSSELSAITNTQGGWEIDLANLRTKDLKNLFAVDNKVKELVVVDTGRVRAKAQSEAGKDKPWPDIILPILKK